MTDSNDMMSVDDLLDSDFDDLEDAPSFEPFQPGIHNVTVTMERKKIGEKQAVEFAFKLVETIELVDTEAEHQKPGSEASIICFLDNEWGIGDLKRLGGPLKVALGLAKVSDTIEQCNDVECVIRTVYRKNKADPDSPYMGVKELVVAG